MSLKALGDSELFKGSHDMCGRGRSADPAALPDAPVTCNRTRTPEVRPAARLDMILGGSLSDNPLKTSLGTGQGKKVLGHRPLEGALRGARNKVKVFPNLGIEIHFLQHLCVFVCVCVCVCVCARAARVYFFLQCACVLAVRPWKLIWRESLDFVSGRQDRDHAGPTRLCRLDKAAGTVQARL
jgi:hypothetical protein